MSFYDQTSDTTNFVISWTHQPRNDFGIFSKGYVRAAERLATQLLESPRFSDYEAYPIVFLYRHALELALKHVIYRSVELAAFKYINEVDDKLHNEHNLRSLAKAAGTSLRLLFPEDKSLRKVIAVVERTCSELSKLDPESYSYRYPIDTKGRPSTPKHQTVNLTLFAEHLSSVLEDLDTFHFGLECEIDVAQDLLFHTIRDALY